MLRQRTSPQSYSHAEDYLADLNGRQMDTLRLIARGRTNGQIAKDLGLTLAGAKWNVSEVLTKLGFESRDDAASFYKWHVGRGNPATRAFRAITGMGLWKTAAAVVLATGMIGAGVGASIHVFGDSEPEQPGLPF
ncbi:MAG: helix-turn-helix transcriptional regulator [Tepidiformaceae bacterium]